MKIISTSIILLSLLAGIFIMVSRISIGNGNFEEMDASSYVVSPDAASITHWDPSTECNETYGGSLEDACTSAIQTSDGGYALAGYTNSIGAGGYDFWLIKTDAGGNHQWNKTYGGTAEDTAASVIQTSDGGYAVAGRTYSYGVGQADFWLVKTDEDGIEEWNQTYGGANIDSPCTVVQTAEGGYALAGLTMSFGSSLGRFWLVRTDSTGNMLWMNYTYGGDGGAESMIQTIDGGYAIAGSQLVGGGVERQAILVKTDENGTMQWRRDYGGADLDWATSAIQTVDGGYALAVWTRFPGAGQTDFGLVKTDPDGIEEWNKRFGGTSDENPESVIQALDGGYVLAGYTDSFGAGFSDFWLVKTDAAGDMLWNITCGGSGQDRAATVLETSDWEYVSAGRTESYGAGSVDFWLVKTEPYPHHDLAVTALCSQKTVVGKNYFCQTNVTLRNEGNFTETFNVNLYANKTAGVYIWMGLLTVSSLPNGSSVTLTLLWNASVVMGNYTISAIAHTVDGETKTEDNTRFDGNIYVGVPCDLTGPTPGVPDGICNMRDISYFCTKFMTTPASPNWDPNCDVAGLEPGVPDGRVDMRDISEACRHFGEYS